MTIEAPSEKAQDPPAFKRRGSIVLSLMAVLVFVGLGPLVTVTWKLIDINREALITSHQEVEMLMASSIASEFDVHVEGVQTQLTGVARTLGAAISKRQDLPRRELQHVISDVRDDRLLYLRYSHFRAKDVQTVNNGELPAELESAFGGELAEVASRVAGPASQRKTSAIVSQPLLIDTPGGGAVLVVSAPVLSGGRFRGVLQALVDLQAVWRDVALNRHKGHTIYAVDEQGRVFASNDRASVRPGDNVKDSAIVQRFLTGKKNKRKLSETMPFTAVVDGAEQAFLGSYDSTPQKWGVFVQAPLAAVYDPIQKMVKDSVSSAVVVFMIATLVAFVFARSLSVPIKRLVGASGAFARGDFTTRVPARSRNELGELAHTFNGMAGEIEDKIRRLRLAAQENNELFLGTIRALAEAIDAKDPYTRGHSVRVNRRSVILARQLGLSDKEIDEIHVASLLHDVGKIGIDDSVLNKPGKLTDEEFEMMKKHTTKGAAIMAPIRKMQPIIPGLRWHHERWGGGGYPDGLSGEEIPLMARIIAVADTFDAVTTTRPYQDPMTYPEALQVVNKLKGVSLDERVVEAFNRAYHGGLIVEEEVGDTEEPIPKSVLEPV